MKSLSSPMRRATSVDAWNMELIMVARSSASLTLTSASMRLLASEGETTSSANAKTPGRCGTSIRLKLDWYCDHLVHATAASFVMSSPLSGDRGLSLARMREGAGCFRDARGADDPALHVPSSFQFESPQRLIGKVSPGWLPPHLPHPTPREPTSRAGLRSPLASHPLALRRRGTVGAASSEMQITPVYGACQEQNTIYCTVT